MSKIDVSQWKEFKIDELFDKCILHKRKKIRREFDLSVKKTLEFDLPVVNAKHDNNGIMYYGRRSDFEIVNKVIDIVQDGASSVGDVYPQFDDVSVLFNAYLIKLKNHVPTENQLVYLSTVLQRAIKLYFSYDNKCTWDKLKRLFIKLPVNSSGKPDWHYMDEYIAKRSALAHKYVSELTKAKDKPEPLNVTGWKEFKIGQIIQFKSSNHVYHASTLSIQKEPTSSEWHPYVVRSAFNNGIRGYVKLDEKDLNPANTISFAQDTAQFFFQTQPYYTGNKIKICSLKDDNVPLTVGKALFLISCMYKSFESFSYETSYTVPRLKRVQIKLPVDSYGNPDWHYMDEYSAKRAALAHKYVSELK